jgi:DNA-binding NarL/FixJ family response regulator
VTQARHEVRTRSTASQPATDRRWPTPQGVDVLDPADAMLLDRADAMIRAFSRFTVTQDGTASAPDHPADPPCSDRSANGHNGTGGLQPVVTPEELAILTLMANGLTLDSVAIRVSMSPRTLSRRLRCVCDRLGVTYPIQAIVWAARQGLI